ncbi:DUF2948 family protein [Rhodospirillaceae bacterium KN72]|uniref:DUF2948 family protein n=1 Tax=Pacificispira spongiicola TaxID=2729598 RepID=A0A7Y0DXY8_9PROT|nr:DUF2948 family protein [Pacificispira spongiicola]NMM42871.1 DUF2948 family protein [Pacificispira spongiicola]
MRDGEKPLKLRAYDLEDLSILSGMVQDSLVPLADMRFMADEGSFILALNRFCWERDDGAPPYARVHSGLRFDFVRKVARRGIDGRARDKLLSLLAIAYHDGTVVLTFSGDGAIRLDVEKLTVALEDLGPTWPTDWKPGHS